MKCRPPFLLYNNIHNSHRAKPNISEKYGNKLNLIFSRIPEDIIKKNPEIEKIVNPQPKIIYDVINDNKKPQIIEITNNMREPQEKVITNLNEFKEMLYDFNQEGEELLGNFSDIQEENDKFSKVYKKIQKDKSKFNTGTYLDHEYLIGIASKYATRGIKVPKINSDKSVFSGNPLILGGSELEDFIVYNLGDRKKSGIFLKKVENLVRRKEAGNYIMSDVERKKFDLILKNEKPKGYIEPNILIPKLKNDILSSKHAYNNIESFDKFFENKKKINFNNNRNNRSLLMSPKMTKNRSYNNIFDNINNNPYNNNKIIIKKNLSFINKINNNNNNIDNNNIQNSNINNKYSNISTAAYLSQKPSSQNSQRLLSYKNISNISKSNISSAVSRDKNTISLKFSPLPSPIYRNSINKINVSILNNLFSGKRRNNNKDENKINNILIKNNRILSGLSEIKKNDRIFSVNDIYKIKKRNEIIGARNNSVDRLKLKKNSMLSKNLDQFNSINIDNNNKLNIISNEDNSNEEKSEENEIKLINKELEGAKENEDKNNNNKKNININIFDNNFDKINENIDATKIEDVKAKNNEDINLPKLQLSNDITTGTIEKSKLNKDEENSQKIEHIYNSILSDGYKSRRMKIEITDFLKSKGYDMSKELTNKDTYNNIMKMKKKMGERNYLLEEFNIRSGELSRKFLSPKQKSILNKNDFYLKKIEDNEYRYKKILLEKNIEKNSNNFDN